MNMTIKVLLLRYFILDGLGRREQWRAWLRVPSMSISPMADCGLYGKRQDQCQIVTSTTNNKAHEMWYELPRVPTRPYNEVEERIVASTVITKANWWIVVDRVGHSPPWDS